MPCARLHDVKGMAVAALVAAQLTSAAKAARMSSSTFVFSYCIYLERHAGWCLRSSRWCPPPSPSPSAHGLTSGPPGCPLLGLSQAAQSVAVGMQVGRVWAAMAAPRLAPLAMEQLDLALARLGALRTLLAQVPQAPMQRW